MVRIVETLCCDVCLPLALPLGLRLPCRLPLCFPPVSDFLCHVTSTSTHAPTSLELFFVSKMIKTSHAVSFTDRTYRTILTVFNTAGHRQSYRACLYHKAKKYSLIILPESISMLVFPGYEGSSKAAYGKWSKSVNRTLNT